MVWHLDVGLSFPKSVGSLIGGSAHPITREINYILTVFNWLVFILTVNTLEFSRFSSDEEMKCFVL